MVDPTVSALLPVHPGADAQHLEACLESLLVQTRSLDEIVVVQDGPLGAEKDEILSELEQRHDHVVRVRRAANQGAGVANQVGLEAASGEWILKADADDICTPERVAVQLATVLRRGVDVCGASMLEFVGREDNVVSLRSMPLTHEQIGARMRWNNPINHPTVFFRRDVALAAGGYPSWRNMQDYGLFARMFSSGSQMMNLEQPLVLFRTSTAVARRRRSAEIRSLEWTLQKELRRVGVVNGPRMAMNYVWRTAFRKLPTAAVVLISRRILASQTAFNDVHAPS